MYIIAFPWEIENAFLNNCSKNLPESESEYPGSDDPGYLYIIERLDYPMLPNSIRKNME